MSRGRSTSHDRGVRDTFIEKGRQSGGDSDKNARHEESPQGGQRSSSRAKNLGSSESRVTSTFKAKERVGSGEQEVSFEKIGVN